MQHHVLHITNFDLIIRVVLVRDGYSREEASDREWFETWSVEIVYGNGPRERKERGCAWQRSVVDESRPDRSMDAWQRWASSDGTELVTVTRGLDIACDYYDYQRRRREHGRRYVAGAKNKRRVWSVSLKLKLWKVRGENASLVVSVNENEVQVKNTT